MNSSYETFSIILKKNKITFVLYFLVLLSSLWSNYSIYVTVLFSGFIFLRNLVLKNIDTTALGLLSFSIIYSLIYLPNSHSWTIFISYLLCPTAFYIFGKYAIDKLHNTNNIIKFWCASILLFSIVLYISTLIDIIQIGFINTARSFVVYGSKNSASMSATLYGMTASLGLVGLPYFFVKQNLKITQYTFLLLSLLSLTTVIHLVNRTGLVVTVICSIIMFFYIFRNKKTTLILTCSLIVIIIVSLIQFDIIDQSIFEAYQNRDTDTGSVDSAGGRTELWSLALNNLFKYPFGWLDTNTAYSHNLWLDIARVAGIMPFVLFFIISIKTYKILFKLLRTKEKVVTPLFLGLHVCFFLTSFVEPVIEAVPLYFYLYLMLWGMQNKFLAKLKSIKKLN